MTQPIVKLHTNQYYVGITDRSTQPFTQSVIKDMFVECRS